MRGSPPLAVLIWGAATAGCRPAPEPPARPSTPAPTLELLAPLPVPRAAATLHAEVRELERRGRFAEAAAAGARFLEALESRGNPADPGLAPYHYNRCLALKLAGALEECASCAGVGRKRWPRSVQHRLLEAAVWIDLSRRRRALAPGTEEAVEELADPRHREAVLACGVDPSSLRVTLASLLFDLERPSRALEHLDRALDPPPGPRKARELKARILMALKESARALPLLESLGAEGPEPHLEPHLVLLLGAALLDMGRPRAAWEQFEKLLSAPPGGEARSPDFASELRLQAALALSRLGRTAEARDTLLPRLLEDPLDAEGLELLADLLERLERPEGARALRRRVRELLPLQGHRVEAAKARREGNTLGEAYYRARILLSADRTGEALGILDRALSTKPGAAVILLLEAEIFLQLGLGSRLAPKLEEEARRSGSPELAAAAARLLLQGGERERAAELASRALSRVAAGGGVEAGMAHLARVWLELGDLQRAWRLAPEGAERALAAAPLDLVYLVRAECLLRRAEPEKARPALGARFGFVAGGEVWARTLRWLAREAPPGLEDAGPQAEADPSDLLDHPRLLEAPARGALSPAAEALRDRARRLHARRSRLLSRISALPEEAALPLWEELLDLYLREGARRKAREAAWFLSGRRPGGLEAERWLARTLSRPEEVLERRAAVERALARHPGEPEFLELRAETERLLGRAP